MAEQTKPTDYLAEARRWAGPAIGGLEPLASTATTAIALTLIALVEDLRAQRGKPEPHCQNCEYMGIIEVSQPYDTGSFCCTHDGSVIDGHEVDKAFGCVLFKHKPTGMGRCGKCKHARPVHGASRGCRCFHESTGLSYVDDDYGCVHFEHKA